MNKPIVIFAGTTEGRELCAHACALGATVVACTATEYGMGCLEGIEGLTVVSGRMNQQDMKVRIKDAAVVLDATHPYATVVSQNISAACAACNVAYKRIVRERVEEATTDEPLYFKDLNAVCEYLASHEGAVLATTGSKELAPFVQIPDYKARVYVRVLPLVSSLAACLDQGFSGSHIIAMQGPFTHEINVALLRSIDARYLVTKDTGNAGGFSEKVRAAQNSHVQLLVVGRPVDEQGHTLEQAKQYLSEKYEDSTATSAGAIAVKQPAIAPGRFPFFMDIAQKKIVVVGGGVIALRRVRSLASFGAKVCVIAPDVKDELREIDGAKIVSRMFEAHDIDGAYCVVATTNNRSVNADVAKLCRAAGILVNVCDNPELCDFFFPALLESPHFVGGVVSRQGDRHHELRQVASKLRRELNA